MNIATLQEWKDSKLSVKEISNTFNIGVSKLYYQYQIHNLKPYFKPKLWLLNKVMDIYDVDGQYLIGYLMGDGWTGSKGNAVYIQTQHIDLEVLYRLASTLGNFNPNIKEKISDGSGYSVRGSISYQLCICSKELVSYLSATYGFVSGRCFTMSFPVMLQNPLPYLRGLFDADGSVGLGCTLTTSSMSFIDELVNFVCVVYNVRPPNVRKTGINGTCYNVTFTKDHHKFLHDLYSYEGLSRKSEALKLYLPN